MNKDLQRIAIAEAQGAVWISIGEKPIRNYRMLTTVFNPEYCEIADLDQPVCSLDYMWDHGRIPDYLSCLNAMHEIEETLIPFESDAWQTYAGWLSHLTPLGGQDHATAENRAEAYLRTLGLWVDTP